LKPEYYSRKKKLREFWDLPNISAVKRKEGTDEFFNSLDWEDIKEEDE